MVKVELGTAALALVAERPASEATTAPRTRIRATRDVNI
jgi:hypothetical protein